MKTITELKEFLVSSFPTDRIYLFGSRARGDNVACSDIDIAIDSEEGISYRLARARLAIEESLIPYKVDLIDLSKAPYLKDIVASEGISWH